MAHPSRREQVGRLLKRLDGDIPVVVVWDRKNDRWDTGKRSMLAYNPDCTHHLVIQDDVLVCNDLLAGVKQALENVPDDAPLCLYIGTRRPKEHLVARTAAQAESVKASFVTMKTLNWGPGICVPTRMIPQMIEYSDKLTDIQNYDRRLSRFWQLGVGTRVWYTWPSLVDHDDGPSLVPGRLGTDRDNLRRARVAHKFLGEDRSALALDWSGPVVHAEGSFRSTDTKPAANTLSVAIMAHPQRREQAVALRRALDRGVPIVWDEKNDRWDTGKRAMLAYDPYCSHHLVLQDDVVVPRDLVTGVIEMLRHVPDTSPVSLYLGKHQRIPEATARAERGGVSFITWAKLDHGLGIVVPTGCIPDMIAYSDRQMQIENYDARLSRYWEDQAKLRTWYTWPSLIDHAHGPSLVPGRKGTGENSRTARRFVGADVSALEVDWNGEVVHAGFETETAAGGSVMFRHKVNGRIMEIPSRSARVRHYMGLSHWEIVGGDTA
jgi:hypothetical protein